MASPEKGFLGNFAEKAKEIGKNVLIGVGALWLIAEFAPHVVLNTFHELSEHRFFHDVMSNHPI